MFPFLLARSARAVFVLVAILAFAFAGTAFAQTDVTTSRISGTAKDSEGGALPGVTVEGKNQDTGLTANATTNSQGFYQLLNLPTGSYTVTATLSGFRNAATASGLTCVSVRYSAFRFGSFARRCRP